MLTDFKALEQGLYTLLMTHDDSPKKRREICTHLSAMDDAKIRPRSKARYLIRILGEEMRLTDTKRG